MAETDPGRARGTMAAVEQQEPETEEYESDPEDAIVPSAMRRREASDDEEEDEEDGGGNRRRNRAVEMGSDGESDGQGAAPAYEDEQDDDDEEYEEEIEEEETIEDEIEAEEEAKRGDEKDLEGSRRNDEEREEEGETKEEGVEEKKENEPYAVPTAGAFYMHDDRFQENGRGRHRRMPGGRGLWESKDNHTWVHDRFEEMNLQEAQYDQGRRNSRGRFRGRSGGKTRGAGRGYAKGNNRSRGYYDEGNNQNSDSNNQNRDGNNKNRPQKSVRGRGPRRYEPLPRNSEVSASQQKQSAKSQESILNAGAGRSSSKTPNVQLDPALPRKNVFASSLNSASPPFYPSGSSKQDMTVIQKRNAQTGNENKTVSSPMHVENNFLASQSGSMLRGKAVVDSFSHDRLYVDDSIRPVAGKALANAQLQPSGPHFTPANITHSSQSRVHGRSLGITAQPHYQPTASVTQIPRVPAQMQAPVAQQRPQNQFQPALRVSTQQVVQQVVQQRPISGNQVSSPPHVPSTNSSEVGEADSPPGSSKTKTQLVPKGKTGSHGAGRGSFLYNGAQVIGASGTMGLSQNDQNFSPALLPVMQFGRQHHGGIPAVGMALPGYVAQPQLGFGNSEMTWYVKIGH